MGTSIFFVIFLVILFMQREVTQSYVVESSILNALVTTAGLNGVLTKKTRLVHREDALHARNAKQQTLDIKPIERTLHARKAV